MYKRVDQPEELLKESVVVVKGGGGWRIVCTGESLAGQHLALLLVMLSPTFTIVNNYSFMMTF